MKKLSFILTIITAALLSSCSDDESNSSVLVDAIDVESEAALESSYEDVDLIIEAGMATLEEADGGKIERDILLDCATVEKDTINKVVTIDYGDGCETDGGRILKGKVIINYNQRKLIPGALRTVTLEDFYVDEVHVQGTRTVENVSESIADNPTFETTLTSGSLTFEDGSVATRDANHIRTWIRANNPLEDETNVEGGAEGDRRDGVRYTVEILERLVYKRRCRASGIFIPVAGVKQITFGDNIAIIDFGDGECDNEVTITLNGEVFTRTVNPRRR